MKHQRCWVHKTANVLDKLPKGVQSKAKAMLHEMYQAETKEAALKAYGLFIASFKDKYPKAVECLEKDEQALFTFYEFPAAHWIHIRTTNPIESTFATVRLRTAKTKGCGSRAATLSMVFKLCQEAEKSWRCLDGAKWIPMVLAGKRFIDGGSRSRPRNGLRQRGAPGGGGEGDNSAVNRLGDVRRAIDRENMRRGGPITRFRMRGGMWTPPSIEASVLTKGGARAVVHLAQGIEGYGSRSRSTRIDNIPVQFILHRRLESKAESGAQEAWRGSFMEYSANNATSPDLSCGLAVEPVLSHRVTDCQNIVDWDVVIQRVGPRRRCNRRPSRLSQSSL